MKKLLKVVSGTEIVLKKFGVTTHADIDTGRRTPGFCMPLVSDTSQQSSFWGTPPQGVEVVYHKFGFVNVICDLFMITGLNI